MGYLDQLAKLTFAEETEALTGGAIVWEPAPEIGLTEVRGDGLLVVRDSARATALGMPWSAAKEHDEIVVELKMQGDHLDPRAMQRSLLRRQAWQVKRIEAEEPPWLGEVPLWQVAAMIPEVIKRIRRVRKVAEGCYRVGPSSFSFLWMAANELPLREELIPFLVARTGRPLVEFARWVMRRRPPAWVLRRIQTLPMPLSFEEEYERYFAPMPLDTPEAREKGRYMARAVLRWFPDARDELIKEEVEKEVEKKVEKEVEKGVQKGMQPLLHQFERRLRRPLTEAEHTSIAERLTRLGPDRVGDVVLDLAPAELAAWVADPAAT